MQLHQINASHRPSRTIAALLVLEMVTAEVCSDFACTLGQAHKPEMLNAAGNDSETCCEPVLPDEAQLLVQSASFNDGSRAAFSLDGQLLYASRKRGLHVAVVRREAGGKVSRNAIQSVQAFDTMRSSAELEVFLDNLTNGTMVLMAVSDSACCRLSSVAKAQIAEFGAQTIDDLRFRSAYALVGIKGSQRALAEGMSHNGEGRLAVPLLVPVADSTLRPLCDARVATPAVRGQLFHGNLVLDAGCQHKLWNRKSVSHEMAGKWMVMAGASNTRLMFHALLQMLSRANHSTFLPIWSTFAVDILVQEGSIVSYRTIESSSTKCAQVNFNTSSHDICKEDVARFLAEVPVHSTKYARLTMFLTQFWFTIPWLIDVVEADRGWTKAQVAWVTQVSSWYVICNSLQFEGCLRDKLKTEDEDAVMEQFKSEMSPALSRLNTFCEPAARAGYLGCVVGSSSWGAATGDLAISFQRFNAELDRAMLEFRSDTLRYVDFYALGAAMPEQTIRGHGSQILQNWAWQVMLGGLFPSGPRDDTSHLGQQVFFGGEMCSAMDSSLDLCPDYVDSCSRWENCNLWMCMNSVPCEFFPTTGRFSPVDGGSNRACAHGVTNHSKERYVVSEISDLGSCKLECLKSTTCTGIGYHATSFECEVWVKQGGADTTVQQTGSVCMHYSSTSTADRGTTTTTTTTATRTTTTTGMTTSTAPTTASTTTTTTTATGITMTTGMTTSTAPATASTTSSFISTTTTSIAAAITTTETTTESVTARTSTTATITTSSTTTTTTTNTYTTTTSSAAATSSSTSTTLAGGPVCRAKKGYDGGQSDAYCAQCAEGYQWWPCNDDRLCECGPSAGAVATITSTTVAGGPVCRAKKGYDGGQSDAYCAQCAEGYQWWPCNDDRLCECGPSAGAVATITSTTVAGGPVCRAKKGYDGGQSDAYCAQCAEGYQWWPCNDDRLCECKPMLLETSSRRSKSRHYLRKARGMLGQSGSLEVSNSGMSFVQQVYQIERQETPRADTTGSSLEL